MEHLTKEQGQELLQKPKRHKFNIQRDSRKSGKEARTIDGILFASGREAARWLQLRILEKQGLISELRRQVIFRLHVNGIKITSLRVDFTYLDEVGLPMIEDAKGAVPELFRIKAKWLKAEYGLEVRII